VTEPEELVRRVLDAHNRGADVLLDAYDEVFDPDFEFTPITVGTIGSPERVTYCGRDGMERYYRDRAEVFAEGEVHIRSLQSAGNAIVVHARSTARGRASGAAVEEDITLVFWVRDGKVVRGEAFRSGRDALEAAGA
jgi:ketosteroid isomerase-like protein